MPQRALARVLVLLVAIATSSSAKLKTDGVVRLFAEKHGRHETEPEAEVQLRLKTKRLSSTRAVVKLEGRFYQRDLYIKDAYLDHKLSRELRLRLGIQKKILGLEYEERSHTRLTLHRTSMYQTLEVLGLVGRQLELSLLCRPGTRDGWYTELAAGIDGSRDQNLVGSLRYRIGSVGFGGWGLIERRRIEHGYLPVWALVSSVWLETSWFRIATEFFSGVDAPATEFEDRFGEKHQVVFYGPRSEMALELPVSPAWHLEPFVQGSLLAHDAKQPVLGHRQQLLIGLNLRSPSLVFRSFAEMVNERGPNAITPATPATRRATYHVSAAYSF